MQYRPGVAGGKPAEPQRGYRDYDLVMAAFVTVLLCANLIGPCTFGAGVLFFPVSYIFGDVLTEVYGSARARKVVWSGFAALAFASFMATAVIAFPSAPGWPHQAAYATVFGSTIVGEGVASLIFHPGAFLGIWFHSQLITVLTTNYCITIGWETLATPTSTLQGQR